MKKKILFAVALAFLMLACQTNDPQNEQRNEMVKSSSPNIGVKENIPLLQFLEKIKNGEEAFVQLSFVDYPSFLESLHTYKCNADPNTIMLSENIGVCIQDSFATESLEGNNICHIRRKANMVYRDEVEAPYKAKRNDPNIGNEDIIFDAWFTMYPPEPLHFIRPYADECNPIPMCYYHQMDVAWNVDLFNPDKVVIIAEWNGVMMDGTSIDTTVIHHIVADDIGVCTLGDIMFSGVPDEALVNLWIIRANTVEVYYDGPITLEQVETDVNPEDLRTFFHNNPEFLYGLQSTILVNGAVAHLPIYLIRNTVNPVPMRQ